MSFKSLKNVVSIAALCAAIPSFADTTYTPADAGWGEALTVADGDTVNIDAGDAGAWNGAITVNKGGTLKTRGMLSVVGTTTVNSGGTLDIESGEAYFAFGSKTAKGAIYIRQGATLKMNRDEAIAGLDAELYIYGSLNSNGYRQRFDHMIFHMYDGSRIYGAGNATYAGLDFGASEATTLFPADYGRLVVHGTVTIETSARVRNGGTFHLASCENSRVIFSDGFYGNSSEGTFIQVPATAEEGNPSGTCGNAVVELGPLGNSTSYMFCSKGIVHLKGATAPRCRCARRRTPACGAGRTATAAGTPRRTGTISSASTPSSTCTGMETAVQTARGI